MTDQLTPRDQQAEQPLGPAHLRSVGQLAGARSSMPNPSDWTILPERFSKEPYGAYVRQLVETVNTVVGVAVGVLVGRGVLVAVKTRVGVGLFTGVLVGVGVKVLVGSSVAVFVGVKVAVAVGVLVAVAVGPPEPSMR